MSKRLLFLPIFLLFYSNSFAMSARLSAIARRAIPYLNRGAAAAKQATAKTVSTAKAAVKQISESKPVLRAKTSSILPKMQKVGLQGLNNNIVKTSAIFAAGLGATTLYYKEPIIDYELQTKIMIKNGIQKYSYSEIKDIIKAYPEAAKLFAPVMVNNLDKFEDYLIVKVIKAYPEAAKLFVQEMLKNLDKFPNSAIADVIEAYPEAAKLFAPKMPLLNGAQSSAHILTHLKHIIDKSNEAALEEQFVKALEKEESILDEHYIPVYHGHRVEYDFLHIAVSRAIHDIRIHNCRLTDLEVLKITRESLLRTLSKDNESFNRFLQLSFIPRSNGQLLDHFYIQTPGKILELIDDKDEYKQVYKQEKNRQQEMMIDRPYAERRIRDPKRMSANPFLFSNTHNSGSCTFAYVQNNYNVHGIQIDWKRDFFNPLGASKQTMQIFTQRFENLQKEYAKCFKRGCILQIALPKENIDELAYLAKIGAYRQTYYTKDRKPMIKLSEFLEETSRNNINPETIDEVELAVPLTQAGLLNPLNGIKIYRYMPKPINEQKYQEIMQEFEQLMQEFKEAIIKDREKNQKIKLAQDKQF